MRTKLSIGIGAAAIALAVSTAAGVASAASSGHQQARSVSAVSSVNKHITKAQARQIAKAKVSHSRVIEVESDDRHDRAVWKVTLATPHGRVIVDVDKRTGKATIVRGGSGGGSGGGHSDAMAASLLGWDRGAGSDRAASEHRRDARDRDEVGDDRGRHHHDKDDNDASSR